MGCSAEGQLCRWPFRSSGRAPWGSQAPRGAGSCGRASQAPSGQLYTSKLDLRSSLLWGILPYVGGCFPPSQPWRHFLS